MQSDLLQIQLHPHVDRAAGNVDFSQKFSRFYTKPDNVLELWDNFGRRGGLVSRW